MSSSQLPITWLLTVALIGGGEISLLPARQTGVPARAQNSEPTPELIWEIRQTAKNKPGIHVVAFSPDGKLLAARDRENELHVYDILERVKLYEMKGHDTNWIETIHFSPDSQLIITAAGSGENLKIWQASTGAQISEVATTAHAAYFSADGEKVFVLGEKQVELYSWPGVVRLGQLNWQLNKEKPVAMSADGKLVLLARPVNLDVFQTELLNHQTRIRSEIPGEFSRPQQLAVSGDNRWIAGYFASGNRVHLWNSSDPKGRHYILDGHRGLLTALAISPDSRFLLSADDQGQLIAWDLLTRQKICQFELALSVIRSLAFSPNSFQFASGGSLEQDSLIWFGDLRSLMLPTDPRPAFSWQLLWSQLGSTDSKRSLVAASTLIDRFDEYRAELSAVILDATFSNSMTDLKTLVDRLTDESYLQRERATRELSLRLNHFEPQLRKLLDRDLPPESRYRVRQVLMKKNAGPKMDVETIRRWHRVIFALEINNTAESRRLLNRIASGHPVQEISHAADAAWSRLGN